MLNLHLGGTIILSDFRGGNMAGTRKVIDCRRFPTEKPCTITIAGTEDEVLDLAVLHATAVHGHTQSPELREQIRSMLQDESTAAEAA
jgi:predicted small metal-binding protein